MPVIASTRRSFSSVMGMQGSMAPRAESRRPRRAGVKPISDIQPERSSPPRGVFAPFAVRSFRFQWPGDLATSLAFEMETLILNWFVLVATGSVMLQTAFAALQFLGTLLAPALGSLADRLGRRAMIAAMRGFYLLLAGCLAALGLTDRLDPAAVFAIAALAGLVRPSDLVMRNALVGDTMADRLLVNAMGFSRTTQDLARIAGALIGATLFQSLGIGPAYLVVGAFYLAAFGLSFGVGGRRARPRGSARSLSVPAELRAGFRHIRRTPALMAAHVAGLPGQPDGLPGLQRADALCRARGLRAGRHRPLAPSGELCRRRAHRFLFDGRGRRPAPVPGRRRVRGRGALVPAAHGLLADDGEMGRHGGDGRGGDRPGRRDDRPPPCSCSGAAIRGSGAW